MSSIDSKNPYDYGVLAKSMFDDDKLYTVEGRNLNFFIVQLKHDLATKEFQRVTQYNWEKKLEAFLHTHILEVTNE
jgi:hypothetical protein